MARRLLAKIGCAGGIVIGVLGGLFATSLLRSVLFEVSPNDPAVAVAALIGVVALAASLIPAWRATRIDPVIALRAD
jgi:ABC-type antimicrobial peptide transport system permease subunit